MLALNPLTDILVPAAVGLVGVVAFGGVLWVRFKGGSLEELRETLMTAKYEIDVANQRTHRLEMEVADEKKEVEKLRQRVQSLESENAILRGAIASGTNLAPEFAEVIVRALHDHEVRSQSHYIEELRKALDEWEARLTEKMTTLSKAILQEDNDTIEAVADNGEPRRGRGRK